MPYVNVKLIEGVFSTEQKRQMIQRLTDAMISIEGERLRELTLVILEEVKSGDWGLGGRSVTTEAVKDLQAGKEKPAR
jgi:4-oxalocrotonate tautomerase